MLWVCVLVTSIGLPQCLACLEASGNVNLRDATPPVCSHRARPSSTWALCCIVGSVDSAGRLLAVGICMVPWHVQCNILEPLAFALMKH